MRLARSVRRLKVVRQYNPTSRLTHTLSIPLAKRMRTGTYTTMSTKRTPSMTYSIITVILPLGTICLPKALRLSPPPQKPLLLCFSRQALSTLLLFLSRQGRWNSKKRKLVPTFRKGLVLPLHQSPVVTVAGPAEEAPTPPWLRRSVWLISWKWVREDLVPFDSKILKLRGDKTFCQLRQASGDILIQESKGTPSSG